MEKPTALAEILEKIDANKALLENRGPLKDVYTEQIDGQYRILNTYTSNAIEGNSFSLLETKLWLEDGVTVEGKTRT
ncbi:MAG: hypothetical protein LBQ12_07730 [Deltaproteobacteria bacterium]|jgi:hypothetical protein|nr:hypothetical protein [Deltaproteobacteria bacterium]